MAVLPNCLLINFRNLSNHHYHLFLPTNFSYNEIENWIPNYFNHNVYDYCL